MGIGNGRRARPAAADAQAEEAQDELTQLVLRARSGDRGALAAIVERCESMVIAVAARYLTRRVDIEDVAQDVWTILTSKVGQIQDPAALRGWLVIVTTRVAWRNGKRNRRLVPTDDLGDVAGDDETETAGTLQLERTDIEVRMRAALKRLRPEDRRLLELLSVNERPDYRAVSRAVGRPIGSIGPTRMRAMAQLGRDPVLLAVDPRGRMLAAE